jgi:hypothetical protein
MLPDQATAFFDRLYRTDLVYEPGCWTRCGDAHCCSFSRHKARFEVFTNAAQELPLLPGEWAYLSEQGWSAQFSPFELRSHRYDLDGYTMRWHTVVSRRPGCACDHATRTTVCRLYPLLPTFDTAGRVTGTDALGMYEELELLDGRDRACKVDAVPFDQLNLFLDLARQLGDDRVGRFYLLAYHHAKRHVFDRLAASRNEAVSVFRQFELSMLRRRLFDHEQLRRELGALLDEVAAGDIAGFAAQADDLHDADLAHLPG